MKPASVHTSTTALGIGMGLPWLSAPLQRIRTQNHPHTCAGTHTHTHTHTHTQVHPLRYTQRHTHTGLREDNEEVGKEIGFLIVVKQNLIWIDCC